MWALWRYVPESYDNNASPHFDYIGAILVTLGMAGITYGAISIGEAGIEGFQRLDLIGILLAGFVMMIAFLIWEGRSKEPMMPLRLFESSSFLGANLLTFFLYGALGGALYFLPLNLIQIQGYGETFAGFAMLPSSILLVILSPFMGGIVDRYGPRLPLVVGPFVVGLGFLALTFPSVTNGVSDFWLTFFPATILLGIGLGITVAPLVTAVMGSVPNQSAGIASGVNNAMSRASQVLALSILGGIGLILFVGSLSPSIEALAIPEQAKTEILASANNLGGTVIPDSLSETEAQLVRTAIQNQFVAMFRIIMWIATGLCVISSILAFIYVEPELVQME
ncbi:MAG: hypothetical protein Phog2KO_34700 [Phototrophicaceae bacterium]